VPPPAMRFLRYLIATKKTGERGCWPIDTHFHRSLPPIRSFRLASLPC
jgi:hypothetical protein